MVAPAQAGARLDQFLAQSLGWSRARLQKLLKAGLVAVNGAAKAAAYRVREGETVTVQVPEPAPSHLSPEPLALDIIYEDRDILVLNKPPGLVVHPGAGHRHGTLLNALLHHCPELKEIGEVSRPGLVHRLDKDTSGLIVVAKTALAHQALVGQFADPGDQEDLCGPGLGPPPGARRDHRQGDRPAPHGAPAHERPRPPGQGRGDALAGETRISRPPDPGGALAPRPGAPTNSGCIWPRRATRCWATPPTAAG